jgi:cytochrome c biogenesis protein
MSLTTEESRLSTAPEPVAPPPPRPSLLATARRTWRQLTSMRTALLLLFLLALAAVPGAFLPQRGLSPAGVEQYFADHPTLAPVLDRLSLFDVYAAPWFAAVYLLLFVSLIGCLGPRIRLHARALRTPPPAVPRTLSRLPEHDRWEVDATPEEVVETVRRALRKGRWRVVRRDPGGGRVDGAGLSAEKGYARETGNLLFHVSLVVLLVGIALGGLFGFQGSVLLKEGDGFANAVFNYDDIRPGRRFGDEDLEPFHFSLDDFRATYNDEGQALTFEGDLSYAEGADAETKPYEIRVNHPLTVGDARVYLVGHGYAPHVVVRDAAGEIALDQAVPCLPQGPTFLSACVIKVPDATDGQLAFEGVFTPTTIQEPGTGRVTSVYPAPEDPALTVVGYRGDLGIDAGMPQSVYTLEAAGLEEIDGGTPQRLDAGETWELPGGGSITFVKTTEWATFQVTQDPGKHLALLASAGMVVGLCLSLFVRRRRVWVRVTPAGPGRTVVEMGGLGRTAAEAFAAEFRALSARLQGRPAPDHDERD